MSKIPVSKNKDQADESIDTSVSIIYPNNSSKRTIDSRPFLFQSDTTIGTASTPTDVNLIFSGLLAVGITLIFYFGFIIPFKTNNAEWLKYLTELFLQSTVSMGITFLTIWSLVILTWKRVILYRQMKVLKLDLLPTNIGDRITLDNAHEFCRYVQSLTTKSKNNFILDRIYHALQHFIARRSSDEVIDYLTAQDQADANAVENSYTMVKVFIWAVPILGFIGTVLGIGLAVSGFSVDVNAAKDMAVLKDSIGNVTSGLGVAFQTTLLALIMSLVIMFPTSLFQKKEEIFLQKVENYCTYFLSRRIDDSNKNISQDNNYIQNTIANEMAKHHAELKSWSLKLEEITNGITNKVKESWEDINNQILLKQEDQLSRLSEWIIKQQSKLSNNNIKNHENLIYESTSSFQKMIQKAYEIKNDLHDNILYQTDYLKNTNIEIKDLIKIYIEYDQQNHTRISKSIEKLIQILKNQKCVDSSFFNNLKKETIELHKNIIDGITSAQKKEVEFNKTSIESINMNISNAKDILSGLEITCDHLSKHNDHIQNNLLKTVDQINNGLKTQFSKVIIELSELWNTSLKELQAVQNNFTNKTNDFDVNLRPFSSAVSDLSIRIDLLSKSINRACKMMKVKPPPNLNSQGWIKSITTIFKKD